MRIAISADHRGHELAGILVAGMREMGHEVTDLRCDRVDPNDDYPDRAQEVANAIREEQADRGIIVCGSGVGACIAANKIDGIRACFCADTYSARQGVQHDDMNVLCLGSMISGTEIAREIVTAFVAAKFSGEERHVRRLEKVNALERGMSSATCNG